MATEVTEAGITTEVRPLFSNAETPIVNKVAGKSIVSNVVQPLNAFEGIAVTPAGVVTWPFAAGWIQQFGSQFGLSLETIVDGACKQVNKGVFIKAIASTVAVLVIENTAVVKD